MTIEYVLRQSHNKVYKVPMITLNSAEMTYWEREAKEFYNSTADDLDFRVEPYEIDEISYKEMMLSDY